MYLDEKSIFIYSTVSFITITTVGIICCYRQIKKHYYNSLEHYKNNYLKVSNEFNI